MLRSVSPEEVSRLIQSIREACIGAAVEAYEQGGVGGLCAEGRWEMAVDAMRALDLDAVVADPHGFEREQGGFSEP